MLVKIDVEEAELIVLRGAAKLARKHRPAIVLSVHPQLMISFRQMTADNAAFPGEHGYRSTGLGTGHEKYWKCEADRAGPG
jgi:hypothetical protein